MTTYLITGGTGALGLPTVAELRRRAPEAEFRVLSRRAGPDRLVGDAVTGEGLAAAASGVDTVVHLLNGGGKEAEATRRVIAAARDAGVSHLVYISIVGVDRIPFPYYRQKLAAERLIEVSGIPFTILRATQFHGFVAGFLDAQRRLPVTLVLPLLDQPVAVEEVAARVAELAVGGPRGRVDDLGGPERLTLRDAALAWQRARGIRRPVWTVRLPGRTMAAFRAGHHLTPAPGTGRGTFAEYLAARDRADRGEPPHRAGRGPATNGA